MFCFAELVETGLWAVRVVPILDTAQDFLIKLGIKPKNCTFKVIFRHQKSTDFFFCEEYLTRRSSFINEIFLTLIFLKIKVLKSTLFSKNVPNFSQFLSALFIILVGLTLTLFSDKMLDQKILDGI